MANDCKPPCDNTVPVSFPFALPPAAPCCEGGAGSDPGARMFVTAMLENQVTSTSDLGCVNGETWIRRLSARYDSAGALVSGTITYTDPTGMTTLFEITDFPDPSGMVPQPDGWTPGPCPVAAVVMASELGCSDGTPYTMQTLQQIDPDGAPVGLPILRWIDSAGNVTSVAPFRFRLGPCMQDYGTVLETVENALRIYDPVANDISQGLPSGAPNAHLVSVSIRHRSGTVEVTAQTLYGGGGVVIAGPTITLDAGEVLNFDAGDDPYGVLHQIAVETRNGGGGSARVVAQYRFLDTQFEPAP